MEEEKDLIEKLCEKVEEKIEQIMEQDLQSSNIDILMKLVDIHKDIKNEIYWKEKLKMRRMYGNYGNEYGGNYGRESYGRRMRDGQGRYMDRGYDTKYKGHEILGDMEDTLVDYHEGKMAYNEGNYGAKEDTLKSLDYMLKSVVDFIEMLKKDATSQEEIELIQRYSRMIAGM